MSQQVKAHPHDLLSHRSIRAWTLAGATALVLTLAAHAANPVRFDVKLGLWEVTTKGKSSGQVPIPDEMLQRMPPAQREQFLAQMQAHMKDSVKQDTHQSCMTSQKVAEGFNTQEARPNCQRQLVSNTESDIEMTEVCTEPDHTSTAKIHIQRLSRELVKGTINITVGRGPRTMNIDSDLTAKWLGSDCGSVKD
jgi:hypothetical protein